MLRKQLLTLVIVMISALSIQAQNFHVQEDFNNSTLPTGWTNNAISGTDVWLFGIDAALGAHAGNQNLDGTAMVFFDDDNLGAASLNNTVELLSPVFDNSADLITTLDFDYNFRQFGATVLDSFAVEVFDGTTWVSVFDVNANDCGNYVRVGCLNNYPHATIDISAYANANCQVRFIYHDGNDWAFYVGIDNVVVSSPFPNDAMVSAVVNPVSGCGLSSAETVSVQIKNVGTLPASNIGVVFDVDNASQLLSETVAGPIAAGDSMVYTFTATADFSVIKSYAIKTYTNLTNDGNVSNDTTSTTVENEPLQVPTFTDDFEGADLWKVQGTNASWELGVPAGTTINSATSGTMAYVTNLNGGYNSNELSYLVSPCFDFSGGAGDPIVSFDINYLIETNRDSLTFESSIDNGVTWQKVNAGFNPTNWFNAPGRWDGNSGGWIPVENILTGLNGQAQVLFRFKFQSDGSIQPEGVGIDNFSIRYPQTVDMSLNSLLFPSASNTPLCGLGNSNIIVEIENKGINQVDTTYLFYSVDNAAPVLDTLIAPIPANSVRNFTFTTKFNFIAFTTYNIDVWLSASGDGFRTNDSLLNRSLTNTAVPIQNMPFSEDFETFQPGGALARGWSQPTNNFPWQVTTNGTPSFNTGPDDDHTPAPGTNYIYTEASGASGIAILESPCIDLGTVQGAIMEVWSHRFGANMVDLFIDVYDGATWVNVSVLNTTPQTANGSPYTLNVVNLNPFAGRRVKVRFRTSAASGFTSDCAIDDILIYEPIPQDVRVARLISPVDGCEPDGTVTVELENFGSADILTPFPVTLNINGGPTITDTVRTPIFVGQSINFTFAARPSFSAQATTFSIAISSFLPGDSNVADNTLITNITNQTQPVSYTEDFESFIDGECPPQFGAPSNDNDILPLGWAVESTAGGSEWQVHDIGGCNGAPAAANTGPIADNTVGLGSFMYVESSDGPGTTRLITPCIDFSDEQGAAMNFWYHAFGPNIGTLTIDVFANGIWNPVPGFSIVGQQQIRGNDPWILAEVKFNQFSGQGLIIRFNYVLAGFGGRGDFAIDDVSFFAPKPFDARMNAVLGPVSGCEINGQSLVTVEVENFGSVDIQPNSLVVGYQIDTLPNIVTETVPFLIPADQRATYTFTTPADLSIRSKTYNIKTFTALPGDQDVDNDTLDIYQTRNETKITNYFEDFENFRDASNTNMLGQVMDNGWTTPNVGNYNWNVQNTLNCGKNDRVTPTPFTGPAGDHTTGTGTFLYTEADSIDPNDVVIGLRGEALFESPCIDLTTNTSARMNFWYHRYGSNLVDLNVQIDSGDGIWNTVSTLSGQTHTFAKDPWQEQTVDLNAFVGKFIRLRFQSQKLTTFGFAADCAIDDILIYEPSTIDVGLTELLSPVGDACDLGIQETSISLENFGTQAISAGQVYVEYSVNNGPWFGDTVQQAIPVGATNITHVFSDSIDFTLERGLVSLRYRATLAGDTILENNRLLGTITNQRPGIPYYLMDFEQHDPSIDYNSNDLRGWTRTPSMGAVPTTFMWHVQCGPAPSILSQMGLPPAIPNGPATGPTGDHTFATTAQNGTGTYMLLETNMWSMWTNPLNAVPDAELVIPCGSIDFTQSVKNEPMLSYWYHMFGPETGDLEVDISFDGGTTYLSAIDKILGQQQQMATDPWLQRRIPLGQFLAGAPAINDIVLRFRAVRKMGIPTLVYPGEGRGGDIAIDDIEILDRVEKDAAAVALLDPRPDCDLSTSERFRMRIQNVGTEDILRMCFGYQITYFPTVVDPITNITTVGDGIVFPPQKDSLVGNTIVPLASFDFSFNNIDLVGKGSYRIKAWTEYAGDNNNFNDTIEETIVHVTRPFPSCEDFSSLTLGDRFRDFQGDVLPNFWEGSSTPYAFEASIENAGPVVGHTGGLNDIYMLVTDPAPPAPGMLTSMESPCFDLTGTQSAILEFWYIMPSPAATLFIRARNRGAAVFTPLDTILGSQGPAFTWTQRRVVLTDFVGDFVELQFENVSTVGAFTAIDDICLIRPEPQQVALQEMLSPFNGNCFYSDNETVSLRLRNIGSDRIDSFYVVLKVDSLIQSNPRGNMFCDTILINASATPPFFEPGDRFTLNLDTLGWRQDMSRQIDYYFSAFILLPGDNDLEDNRILDIPITHPVPLQLPYCEDFEAGVGASNLAFQGGPMYTWTHLNDGVFASGIYPGTQGLTGPSRDHTIGNASGGFYALTDGSAGNAGEVAVIQSRCLDLSQTIQPELEYWYYMFVPDGATLILEINDDNGWVEVDRRSNTDPDQGTQFRDWKSQIVDLSAYRGRFIRYRFLVVNASVGSASNVALDDICVYDVAAKDIAAFELVEPNADSTSCYSENQQVRIGIRNNGVSDIGLPGDTITAQVRIFKTGVAGTFAVLTDTFTVADFHTGAPVVRDSVAIVTMDSTFDMSELGSTFTFDISLFMDGDLINSNDMLNNIDILSQRHTGSITSITPNDVVCFGTPVTVTNTGYFGALLWENRVLDANGNGNWVPVQTNPRDRPSYIALLDTTTDLRTRVCAELFFTSDSVDETTDSVRIEVIKPFRPTGISDFRCENPKPEDRMLGVTAPSNVDSIYWFADNNILDDTNIVHRMAVNDFFVRSGVFTNDTLYAMSVQYDSRLDAPGFCTSNLTSGRSQAIAGVNHVPRFAFADTANPTVSNASLNLPDDSLWSYGNLFNETFNDIMDTICEDRHPDSIATLNETVFLDAGQRLGSQWTYEWNRISLSTEDTVTFNTQSVVVDHLDLQVQESYVYQVTATTDSGCVASSAKYVIYVGNGCITSLNEVKLNEKEFGIFPNPVIEELTITHKSAQSFIGSIELRSAEGQLIEIFRDVTFGTLEHKIDMSNLAKGVYFIKINSELGTLVEKVVKN